MTDTFGSPDRIHLIEHPSAPEFRSIELVSIAPEYGSWSAAWVGDDDLLISGLYPGSGWAHLRRLDLTTEQSSVLADVRQNSMLAADPSGEHVLVAEHNISSGPVRVLDPETGDPIQTFNTSWFLFDITFDGRMAIVPSYFGGFVYDFNSGLLEPRAEVIGSYADHGPISTAFAPHTDAVFESTWSHTVSKRALSVYLDRTLTNPQVIEAASGLSWVGNGAFNRGRLAVSRNGYWLAMTLDDSVRFYDVRELAAKPGEIFASDFGRCPD